MERDIDPSGADKFAMGERIREARQTLKIQTVELGRRFGLTPSMISYTERGINGPSYRVQNSRYLSDYYNGLKVAVTIWTQSQQFRNQEPGQDPGGKYPDPASELPLFPFPVQPPRVLLARLDALLVRRYFRTERLGVG